MEKKLVPKSSGRDVMKRLAGQNGEHYTDKQLIANTERVLVDAGILDRPIRHVNGSTYYFDENKILCASNNNHGFSRGDLWHCKIPGSSSNHKNLSA